MLGAIIDKLFLLETFTNDELPRGEYLFEYFQLCEDKLVIIIYVKLIS